MTFPSLGPGLLLVSILTRAGYFQLFAEPFQFLLLRGKTVTHRGEGILVLAPRAFLGAAVRPVPHTAVQPVERVQNSLVHGATHRAAHFAPPPSGSSVSNTEM